MATTYLSYLTTSKGKGRPDELRIHDLVAKVAHVRLKDTLRVLLALRAVSTEYDVSIEHILDAKACPDKPNVSQAVQCQHAYNWMYDNPAISKTLFQIEQLK